MKLSSAFIATTLASRHKDRTIDVSRRTFGPRVCGMLTGESGHLEDSIKLRKNESCIFRIKPAERESGDHHIHLTLLEASRIDCREGHVNVVIGDEIYGPYCSEVDLENNRRHRRGWWSSPSGLDAPANKEIDMVYSRTSGGGFRFSFNFEFEFELLPGLPGAGAQNQFIESLGSYYKPTPKPYAKPTVAPPKPSKKPTTAPYRPPTSRPTTKYTTKRTTTAPYVQTTRPTTKPTTKYTTKRTTYSTKPPTTAQTYNFFWEPDHSQYISYPGPFDSSKYCPYHTGTWYNGAYSADCGDIGVCNHKYTGRCFNNIFNMVHKDLCPKFRKRAKAIHTDIMGFFVELGVKFSESRKMACEDNINGYLNQGVRGTSYEPVESTQDRTKYHTGGLPLDDEDYEYYDEIGLDTGRYRRYSQQPACKQRAGIQKCSAIDYSEITGVVSYLNAIKKRIERTGTKCNSAWNNMMMDLYYELDYAFQCREY